MKTYPSFGRPQGFVILDSETLENLYGTIIHMNGQGDVEFSHGHFQERFHIRSEPEPCRTCAKVHFYIIKKFRTQNHIYPCNIRDSRDL